MLGINHRRFSTLESFEKAWIEKIEVTALVRDLGETCGVEIESAFQGAVHYLAGFLGQCEFRMFRNGGLPLIERHTGAVREEILVRLGPNSIKGAYVPIQIQLHVTNPRIREIRERYWPGAGRAPVSLFGGNTGLLQPVPTYDIWNVASEETLSEIVNEFRSSVLPFLDLLDSPARLRKMIFDGEKVPIDSVAATEWLLLEFGQADARMYLRSLIDSGKVPVDEFWESIDQLKLEAQVSYRPGNQVRNLAVVAFTHDLTRRYWF